MQHKLELNMLARSLGLLLAGAAIVGFASTASATGTGAWTDMADELNGKKLTFHGHDLGKINWAWHNGKEHGLDRHIDDMVWNMEVDVCMGDMCERRTAEIWMKSGSMSRYHAFYRLDGERWRRARPVPEPTAAAAFALGLGVVGARLRRRK